MEGIRRGAFQVSALCSTPESVKVITQNGSPDGNHAIGLFSFPTHAGTDQALFELFDAAFDGARANGKALFAKGKILHPALMSFKIAGEVSTFMAVQSGDDFVDASQIEMVFVNFEPALALFDIIVFRAQSQSRLGQVLHGMKPVHTCGLTAGSVKG